MFVLLSFGARFGFGGLGFDVLNRSITGQGLRV